MIRRAVLAVLAIALIAPAAASAAPDTVIGFDGLADNTLITDQYAGVGVTFGDAATFGFPEPAVTCHNTYAATAGINGPSAWIACATGSVEFPDRRFGTAIEFSTERRAVSFNLQQRTPSATQTATVSFYAIGPTLLSRQTITLNKNAVVGVSYANPTTDGGVVGIVVSGQMSSNDSGGVFLDDLDATLDDVPPPKKFSLALATPSIDAIEGSTGQSTLSVRRYNGSTGPVTLSVDSLPPGIAATQFSTNPVSGTNPTTLGITLDKPLSGQRQLTISASGGPSAGTGIGTSLVQTITAQPAVYFATGGRFTNRLVPGCGPQRINDSFNARGGYNGSVNASLTALTGGLSGTMATPSVTAFGDGVYPIAYNLDPGNGDGGGTFDVRLDPFLATPSQVTLNWLTDRVSVNSVADPSPTLPLVDGNSTVTVIGNFPSICPVTFQDGAGQAWSVRTRDTMDVGGRQMDAYTLNVPAAGVSGPLHVLGANGAELATTQRIDLREFRNVYALSQGNSGSGAKGTYNWDDFERTFGSDDAEACFIVCVRDPVAVGYYNSFSSGVSSGNGLCVGYTVMAARFRGYGSGQRPSDYQPGATRAWQIAPTTDGTAVKRDIVRWFVAQNDKGFAKARDNASGRSPADERQLLKDLINQADAALISIRQGGAGHSLLAYGIQDQAGGGVKLFIYDPNVPYTTSEETSSAARSSAQTQSTITIAADGSWSGTSLGWKGDNSTLRVVPQLPPDDASLPSNFSLASLFDGSAAGGPSPATITGITANGKQALGAGGEPTAGSGVTVEPVDSGVQAEPRYQLAPGRAYDFAVRGTQAGTYDNSLLGDGAGATVSGADTKPGQVDHVVLRPGQATLGFSTGAHSSAVTYDLVDKSGKASRTATIALTARSGGADEAELGGGVLRIAHDGAPTTATVTLGSVGAGLPGSVQTAPMALGRGQRLELSPRAWSNLAGGVRFTLRTKSGRVMRRGTVRLVGSSRVGLAGVKARHKGKTLTVTGRVARRGSAPLLAVTATITRAGKTLRRRSATLRGAKVKKGRFSLPVTIGTLPAGARVRVDVLLIDEGSASLATAHRQLTVR